MDINLAIDQGNSSAKVAFFHGEKLLGVSRYAALSPTDVEAALSGKTIHRAIYSTVKEVDCEVTEALRRIAGDAVILDYLTPIPVDNAYATPSTLGLDRLAAAVGAAFEAPGCNCLIIDAGTAVTLDVLTADRRFLGGNISPGLSMRFEALHSHTSKLPLIDTGGEMPEIGYDTATAIRSGVAIGLACEIDSYIARMRRRFGNALRVFLTGGDSHLIASLSCSAEIIVDENLLMKGLNRILLYNEKI